MALKMGQFFFHLESLLGDFTNSNFDDANKPFALLIIVTDSTKCDAE